MRKREFRAYSFDRPLGPWRDVRADAEEDAIIAGEADRSEFSRAIYWKVGCRIDERPKKEGIDDGRKATS